MAFGGWPEAAIDFFEGLERDNSKTYWTAHRAIYDEAVLGPMTELTEDLAGDFGPARILRPYRDIRFSKDKTLYRTEIGAMVGFAYIRLSADGLGAGNGLFHLLPDQLARYRQAVAGPPGAELGRITTAITAGGAELIGHDRLKTVPRGYPADHPRAELLRYKGLAAFRQWPPEPWLSTPAAKDHITGFLAATAPLIAWLERQVGPSAEPAGSRGSRR
ncbi:MAG TPA: DUF2461 domain-containing protein [Streptosporangiaceae bacterium]